MRGLKLTDFIFAIAQCVASFTDAWIETQDQKYDDAQRVVASFTDAWIETNQQRIYYNVDLVASFTDAWIETGLKESRRSR